MSQQPISPRLQQSRRKHEQRRQTKRKRLKLNIKLEFLTTRNRNVALTKLVRSHNHESLNNRAPAVQEVPS